MVEKCDICGKICKNGRGVAIHKGHIHKKEQKYLTEIAELKEDIATLKSMVISLTSEIRAGMPTAKVPMSPPKKPKNGDEKPLMGLNYGENHGALMQELKKVLANRN